MAMVGQRSRRTRVVKARYVLSRIDKDGKGKAMYTLSIMLQAILKHALD